MTFAFFQSSVTSTDHYMGFGFPNTILIYSDSVSVFLPCHLSLLPSPVCFLFVFEFSQELVHPCRPLTIVAWLSACLNGLSVSLENVVLENQPGLLDTSSCQDFLPGIFPSRSPNRDKICFREIQGWDPAFSFFPLLRNRNSTSHGHHSQGCPRPSHPWPVLPGL